MNRDKRTCLSREAAAVRDHGREDDGVRLELDADFAVERVEVIPDETPGL